MDTETLSAVVALLVVLSIASERLVEIVKGHSTWLNKEREDPKQEGSTGSTVMSRPSRGTTTAL